MKSIKIKKPIVVRISFVLLFMLLLNTIPTVAQNKIKRKMLELKSKDKKELIQMAVDLLKEKQPVLEINFDGFESTAWGNSKERIVKFRRYIRFIPLNAERFIHYDITVNLVTGQILPFESGYNYTFSTLSEKDKKVINYIKEKAPFIKQSKSEVTITESEDNYWISETSKTSFRKFFINKKSGFMSGIMEGSYSSIDVDPVLESIYKREEMVKIFDTDEVNTISKNAIISLAKEVLKKKHPSLNVNFDDYKISILGDSKNTIVEFRKIIKYIPLALNSEKSISYDLKVNLNTNEISPFDDVFDSEFYVETPEDKKALRYIKNHFSPLSSSFENTIEEKEEEYLISIDNEYSFGRYVLDKKTGKHRVEIEGSMEPMPKFDRDADLDTLLEIK